MLSRSAITKLKAILIIDLIIVAAAAGAYFYLQAEGLIVGQPKPAEFTVTNLTITPSAAEIFEPVLVTVNVTNIGDEKGEYIANLTINSVIEENQTVTVLGRNSTVVEFTIIKETEGTYTVEMDGLSGSLTVKLPPPTASKIGLSKLSIAPYEAWPNETITATVSATNVGDEEDSLAVRLMIDNSLVERRIIKLAAKETTTIVFMFNVTAEVKQAVKYAVKVNSLTGAFIIVPEGFHTLNVGRSGGGSKPLKFTLNGVEHETSYVALLPVGQYTITVPKIVDVGTGILEFDYWNDGSTSTSLTFTLDKRLIVVATYRVISGYASCPSLFFWNGTHYVYVTEVSNAGWLGYMDYIDEKGNIVFGGGNPWDVIKLDADQLVARHSLSGEFYDVILLQKWDEIFYLDKAYLMVVDHPADVDVYSTMVNYVNKAFPGEIYTISTSNLLKPVSAVNENGENVLAHISKLDGVFTPGINGLNSLSWDKIKLNQLTLNLGDLSGAREIKLVINGMVDWGLPEQYYKWIDGFKVAFAAGLVPNGTQIYPPPYMEVMDANGNWVRVPQNRQMPTPSDYVPRSFVVDLTGLFPADVHEYKIRITNFFNVTFDYIGVTVTPQTNIRLQRIDPDATLHQVFASLSSSTGAFTRYGDVTQLVREEDDMFVVGRQGDQVSLRFSTVSLLPLEDGMKRSYFMFVACWFKDPPGTWGYGFDFTVDPLPFRNMSGFPYSPVESYPYDEAHMQYLGEYNTRIIKASSSPLMLESSATWATVVIILIAAVDLGILVYFKKHR